MGRRRKEGIEEMVKRIRQFLRIIKEENHDITGNKEEQQGV